MVNSQGAQAPGRWTAAEGASPSETEPWKGDSDRGEDRGVAGTERLSPLTGLWDRFGVLFYQGLTPSLYYTSFPISGELLA